MSRIRLILIPPSAALPASCLTLDAQGVVLTRGVLELGSGYAPEPMRNVAVVPGADVLVRWLELPAGSPAQMAATALHLLRDDLAAPSDRLTAVLGTVPTSGRRLVAVAGRSLVQTWSDYLASFGLRADVMIPDSLILPEPEEKGVLTVALFGADLALRGRELALSVQPDLAEAVAAGRAVKRIEWTDEIERLLAAAALNPPINLLAGGGRRVEADRRGWKRAAALATALIVSPLILTLAAAGHDEWRARDTESRAEAAARRAFSDIAPGADAVAEATRRLSTAPPGGAAAAAAALFAAVESVEGAELDSLTVDEAGVRATVTYAAYQDLDALQQAMAAKGMSLTDESTVDDQGKVVSEVRVGGAG